MVFPTRSFTEDDPAFNSCNDDDEDSAAGYDEDLDLTTSVDFVGKEEERDQAAGLLQRVAKETRRVAAWRIIVTLAILGTAAAVTGVTYSSLKKEEQHNFETAVSFTFDHDLYMW